MWLCQGKTKMNLLRIGKRVRTPGNWEDLQRQLDQYLKVANSIRQPSPGQIEFAMMIPRGEQV